MLQTKHRSTWGGGGGGGLGACRLSGIESEPCFEQLCKQNH